MTDGWDKVIIGIDAVAHHVGARINAYDHLVPAVGHSSISVMNVG